MVSVIHRDHAASIRVAERIRWTFERDYDLGGEPCVIYGQSIG
jgi:hypothetical protein